MARIRTRRKPTGATSSTKAPPTNNRVEIIVNVSNRETRIAML